MDENTLQRQVALVSYGNKFLRSELTLEDMYRHGVFHQSRLLFRTPDENALLADDFTLWLEILRVSGARRLSLHRAVQFEASAKRARAGGELLLAVHYPEHYQLWVCGEEHAAWWSHSQLPKGEYDRVSDVPSAAYYGGAIDTYWFEQEIASAIAVPETDWKGLEVAIEADLQLTLAHAAKAPFYPHMYDAADWARLPLFPYTQDTALPHQLMQVLTDAQAAFANDSNCKNEHSTFRELSEEDAAEKSRWSRRLDQWIIDLQFHCANYIGAGSANCVAAGAPESVPARQPDANAASLKPAIDATAVRHESRWCKAGVFALLLGLLSLLLLAICHVIAAHAWLSLALGLPFAFYVVRKGWDG